MEAGGVAQCEWRVEPGEVKGKDLEQQALQFILHSFEKVLSVSEEFLDLRVEELSEVMGRKIKNL